MKTYWQISSLAILAAGVLAAACSRDPGGDVLRPRPDQIKADLTPLDPADAGTDGSTEGNAGSGGDGQGTGNGVKTAAFRKFAPLLCRENGKLTQEDHVTLASAFVGLTEDEAGRGFLEHLVNFTVPRRAVVVARTDRLTLRPEMQFMGGGLLSVQNWTTTTLPVATRQRVLEAMAAVVNDNGKVNIRIHGDSV